MAFWRRAPGLVEATKEEAPVTATSWIPRLPTAGKGALGWGHRLLDKMDSLKCELAGRCWGAVWIKACSIPCLASLF